MDDITELLRQKVEDFKKGRCPRCGQMYWATRTMTTTMATEFSCVCGWSDEIADREMTLMPIDDLIENIVRVQFRRNGELMPLITPRRALDDGE